MNHPESAFDAYYYRHCCGALYERNEHWLNFFGGIARRIAMEIHPGSALDAGCAMGLLVECLRKEGIDANGVDISEYAIGRAYEVIQPHLRVGSLTEPFLRNYDLIVCIEVLEHMPKADAEKAIENLCQATGDILFSSTPFDYREATHVNVQMPDYWTEQFARQGFYRDIDFDASFITPWAVRFRRRSDPAYRILRDYDRKLWELRKENLDLRALASELTGQLAQAESKAGAPVDRSGEVASLSVRNVELSARIVELEEQARTHEERWADLQRGWLWHVVQAVWRVRLWLIPRGSRREKLLNRLKNGSA